MKVDGWLGRNHLLGTAGDAMNALRMAAGNNLRIHIGDYCLWSGPSAPLLPWLSIIAAVSGTALYLPHLCQLAAQDVDGVPFRSGQILQLYMIEQHLKHISNPPELPAVTSNLVENPVLDVWAWRLPKIDVEKPKLHSLLIECPREDVLPEVLWGE